MVANINSVHISIGSIVLDRPDQSGEFIARDLVGGWAYIVADNDGDRRFRGQGSCAGGLAAGLRYAFVSAMGCVPECQRITLYVDTTHAHQQMVQLATSDAQVVSAIASRPVFVMTRPQERSSHHVRQAAERAAAAALREREQLERHEAPEPSLEPAQAEPEPAAPDPVIAPEPRPSWRKHWSRRSALDPRTIRIAARSASRHAAVTEPKLVFPAVEPAASPQIPSAREGVLTQWLHEFDNRVESVRTGLQSVGW